MSGGKGTNQRPGTTMRALCRSDTGRRLHGVVSNLPALNVNRSWEMTNRGGCTTRVGDVARWRSPQPAEFRNEGDVKDEALMDRPYIPYILCKFERSGIK
ncbi:hypothetical protein AVEN_21242-1 [Araneus ventricosus]|uniref:Uncharacterized protein n=1 Tax=Araneus ventricosus TaxID=182803 RepID=A0A4Y2GGT0_ARAVE|nr:hypothetical protein AVEN_21242-1 [Araneus ventricosus]